MVVSPSDRFRGGLSREPTWAPEARDRGLANFDVRNVAAINETYALPSGKGKPYLHDAGGAMNALAGGWMVSSVVTIQGGFPFTPQLSYNPSNNGDTRNPVHPFVNPPFNGPVILGNPNQWFNPAAFLAPPNASGFYGNLGRDTLAGPGLATWDLSLVKDTRIRERLTLQFRAEGIQSTEPRQFQHAERGRFHSNGCLAHGWGDHQHIYSIAAGSIRIQVALVDDGAGMALGQSVAFADTLCSPETSFLLEPFLPFR